MTTEDSHAADEDGRRAAQAGRQPGRGDQVDLQGRPPQPQRPEGSEAADRLLHLRRPDRRRQDAAGQGPGRVHVRRRGRADPDRHERVHGEAQRQPADRRSAGLRRLRGRRPADREDPPPAVRRGAARRNREGPPRRLQHAAAGHGRRPADRQLRPQRRLPQHDPDHDHQRRRRGDQERIGLRLPEARRRRLVREHEGPRAGADREGLPARVPQPRRRHDRLPPPDRRRPGRRGRAGAEQGPRAARASTA